MKTAFIPSILTILSIELYPQLAIVKQHAIGGTNDESGYAVEPTTDGGFVTAGWTYSNDSNVIGYHGLGDFWVVKLDDSLDIQWARALGGSLSEDGYSLKQTSDGGYVVVGQTRSNDGDVSGNHGGDDWWVVKLDAAGNISWQKTLGGSEDEWARSVDQTTDGGYIIAGFTASNDGDVTGLHGVPGNNADCWVVKLDQNGNLIWQKVFGGSSWDEAKSIQQTFYGGYVVAGYTNSNDGDINNTNHGGSDYWVLKLDPIGNIEWQKTLGGSGTDQAHSIEQTTGAGYIVAGYTNSSDGDVTVNHGQTDYWIVKLDAGGGMQWQKSVGGSLADKAYSVIQTIDGGFLIAGESSSTDGDINANKGSTDCWVVKLSGIGTLDWERSLGGSNVDRAYSIRETSYHSYVLSGASQSSDGDLTSNIGDSDVWMVTLAEHLNVYLGRIYLDLNNNGVLDFGEPTPENHRVEEAHTGRFAFSWGEGFFNLVVTDTGNFIIVPQELDHYMLIPTADTVHFDTIQQFFQGKTFRFQPIASGTDLVVTITPLGRFRPGRDAQYLITYENRGTITASNVRVTFLPDTSLMFTSASVNPTNVTPDSVIWNIVTLPPFEVGSLLVTVKVSENVPAGTPINSKATVGPTANDLKPENNEDEFDNPVRASYDPNDIIVNHTTILNTAFPNPPDLDYVIRFQNTGNDTAFTVKIKNFLPKNTDYNTVDLIGFSHPVRLKYNNEEKLMWFEFENILLPDSTVNEPASHGYVRYRIRPLSTLVLGDSIKNTASIFFDFNAPVTTNTAVTEVVMPVGLSQNPGLQYTLITYPNPATSYLIVTSTLLQNEHPDLFVYDLFGRMVIEKRSATNGSGQSMEDISSLSSGVYIIEIKADDNRSYGKFIKQ